MPATAAIDNETLDHPTEICGDFGGHHCGTETCVLYGVLSPVVFLRPRASSDFVPPVCPRRPQWLGGAEFRGGGAEGADRQFPSICEAPRVGARGIFRHALGRARVSDYCRRHPELVIPLSRSDQGGQAARAGDYRGLSGDRAERGSRSSCGNAEGGRGRPQSRCRAEGGDIGRRIIRRARQAIPERARRAAQVLPHWRGRAAKAIKRADVIELVEGLVAAGTPTLANRIQALVSKVYSFGIDAAELENNPCFRMAKRGAERVRTRVLSDDEIRLLWFGVIEPARKRRSGLALRLCLLTGARVSEVAEISRAELQRISEAGKGAWIIPGARTKNKKPHIVPLSPLALAVVLDLLDMIGPQDEYLLPTRSRKRRGPIRGNTLTQAMDYFSVRLSAGKEPRLAARTWIADPPTPHALRRTVETRLAEMRIPKEVRDRCLNHIPADVGSKHYNQHDYFVEKAEAFNRWAASLSEMLNGSSATVVPLAAARKGRHR